MTHVIHKRHLRADKNKQVNHIYNVGVAKYRILTTFDTKPEAEKKAQVLEASGEKVKIFQFVLPSGTYLGYTILLKLPTKHQYYTPLGRPWK